MPRFPYRAGLTLRAVASLAMFAVSAPAAAQYWVGFANDQNWNTANNWLGQTVPNSPSAVVNFQNVNAGPINIVSSVQAGSLNYIDVGAASFTLTSSPGQTLSGLAAINYLNPTGFDTGTQTINLANVSTGSLLFPAGGPLTITNNGEEYLVIGPNTVIGTPGGAGGVVVAGVGATTLSGSFATGQNAVTGGLTKTGAGYVAITGDGTNLTGGLSLNGGTLVLDYTTNPATKLGSGNLTLSGGTLELNANATPVTQIVNGTTLAANHTTIEINTNYSTANVTLSLGAITRSAGATVDFITNIATFTIPTSTGATNGLLGAGPAYATVGGATWASKSAGAVVGLPNSSYGVDTYGTGINTDFVSYQNLSVETVTNSVRFNNNAASNLLYIGAVLTLQSGGILMTSNSGPVSIEGGTLTTPTGAGELLIHQYNTFNTALTIDAAIASSGGLTKTGGGALVLGGANSGLTGPINVNQGNLTVTQTTAVNSASTINLNENYVNQSAGLSVQLDFNANGTIVTNIRLNGTGAPNTIDTGASINSTITLSGVISSTPGRATPLGFGFGQDISSGINLTGVNTFLGNVYVYGGTLGINSNASLGDPANTLYLRVGSSTAGGLVFLNSGVNIARQVMLVSPTRFVSNGADVNTISGVIGDFLNYGGSRLYKAGIGTLIVSGMNSYSGGTQIDAGTLSVGADVNLGAALTSVTINNGATLAVSSSFSTARPLLIGPTSATVPNGAANISVAAGQVLSLTGGIADNVGPSTLALTGPGTVFLSTPNTYSGGTVVQRGTLQVGTDAGLGAAAVPVTIGPLGTLMYMLGTSTSRTIVMNNGTLSVAASQILTLSAAAVGGGVLAGPGEYTVTNGTTLTSVTTYSDTYVGVAGPATFTNFSNGSPIFVAAGPLAQVSFNRFTNQGSGAITIAANSQVNASNFQTYGLLTVNNGFSPTKTLLMNTGASPLYFNGGSRTFIGAVGGNGQAQLELNGQNAIVAGGLFVNNGHVTDNSAAGVSTIIADYGALVKGAGQYDNSPITQNGGKFQAGNSPGVATVGRFVFGPGGVSNYVFAIDDATGQAGPTPDALGHVSGWGLVKAAQWQRAAGPTSGDFVWTADPANKLTVAIDTLVNPTITGTDVTGLMADFDPTRAYSWPAVQWTGTYSGPTDVASLDAATNFDVSGFANPIAGTFGWDLGGSSLSLSYTPSAVPEPGTRMLVGLTAAAGWWRRRRQTLGQN